MVQIDLHLSQELFLRVLIILEGNSHKPRYTIQENEVLRLTSNQAMNKAYKSFKLNKDFSAANLERR